MYRSTSEAGTFCRLNVTRSPAVCSAGIIQTTFTDCFPPLSSRTFCETKATASRDCHVVKIHGRNDDFLQRAFKTRPAFLALRYGAQVVSRRGVLWVDGEEGFEKRFRRRVISGLKRPDSFGLHLALLRLQRGQREN